MEEFNQNDKFMFPGIDNKLYEYGITEIHKVCGISRYCDLQITDKTQKGLYFPILMSVHRIVLMDAIRPNAAIEK